MQRSKWTWDQDEFYLWINRTRHLMLSEKCLCHIMQHIVMALGHNEPFVTVNKFGKKSFMWFVWKHINFVQDNDKDAKNANNSTRLMTKASIFLEALKAKMDSYNILTPPPLRPPMPSNRRPSPKESSNVYWAPASPSRHTRGTSPYITDSL